MRDHVLWLPLLLGGCMFSYTPAGPTYLGDVRIEARLRLIAEAPSEAGADEAMDRWVRDPQGLAAREAVLACARAFPGPVEARFAEISPEGQALFFADAQKALTGADASGLIARLSRASGMAKQGIAALAGRQDPEAVTALLEQARGTGTEKDRVAAVEGLEPPSTALAQDGLIALARDTAAPMAVRSAAVTVLAPFDTPAVRGPMLALAAGTEDSLARAALLGMGPARDEAELRVVLDATRREFVAASAVTALERSFDGTPLAPAVQARLVEMVDVSGTAGGIGATSPEQLEARFQAARVLSVRDDARAHPLLVRLLDSPKYRAAAEGILESDRIAMLTTLVQDAPALTTAEGKAGAARLVATFGGPDNAALVRGLAAPRELEGLLARLPTAPWGLFPQGKVAYVPAITDRAPVEHALLDAMRAGDAVHRTADDPVTRYIGAARAYLAGSRSREGVEFLRGTAAAAKAAYGLAVLTKVNVTGDAKLGTQVVGALTERITRQSGVKVVPRTEPSGAALTATGELTCRVEDTTTRTRLANGTYDYELQIHNDVKDELARMVKSFPENLKIVEECTNECTYNPSTTAQYKSMMPCDYVPVGVDAVCRRTVKQLTNPEYAELVKRYEKEPVTVPVPFHVPMTRIEVTKIRTERCEGPLGFAVGSATHTSRVAYTGTERASVVERSADPVGANNERLAPWRDTQPGERSDDRATRFEAAIAAALGSYRPGEPEVRRMYEDHVRLALAAGDLRAARQSLVWARPALVGTDVASLDAFRQVFFSNGEGAFPGGWR